MRELTLNELIAAPEEKDVLEEAKYVESFYKGGLPVAWEKVEEEDWPPEIGPGDLVATCAEGSYHWEWFMVTTDAGAGYRLDEGRDIEYPDANHVPVLAGSFDDVLDLMNPIVCVVHTDSIALEGEDLLHIIRNGRDVFDPAKDHSKEDRYACRYVSHVLVVS